MGSHSARWLHVSHSVRSAQTACRLGFYVRAFRPARPRRLDSARADGCMDRPGPANTRCRSRAARRGAAASRLARAASQQLIKHLGIPQSTKGLWPHFKSAAWGITPEQVSNPEPRDFPPIPCAPQQLMPCSRLRRRSAAVSGSPAAPREAAPRQGRIHRIAPIHRAESDDSSRRIGRASCRTVESRKCAPERGASARPRRFEHSKIPRDQRFGGCQSDRIRSDRAGPGRAQGRTSDTGCTS